MPTPSHSHKDTPSTKAWTTSWHLKSQGRQALRPHPPATFCLPNDPRWWRLTFDNVRHSLAVRKPQVARKDNIALRKGVPIKVLWRRTAASSVVAAAQAREAAPAPIMAASEA